MPLLVRPETDERDALLEFLATQRDALRRAAHGLTEEQDAATPTASALSVAGLVKHVAEAERHWIVGVLCGRPEGRHGRSESTWADAFRLVDAETLAGALDAYAAVARETEEIVRALPDLEATAALPDRPWLPPGSRRSARWILLHLVQETARHAGHADIIRESLDGATAAGLMAAAEE